MKNPRRKLRKPWEDLAVILEKAPVLDMLAKQAELLEWLEQHQDSYKEDTLEYWTMDRLANLLASEQDDTLGLLAAIEDILQALKRRKAPGQGLLQIGFANVTSYRPEVKTWVMERPEPVWCLQETHLAGAEHEQKVHELRRSKKVVHSQKAYPTEAGGTSGGVLTLASAHLNVLEGPGWMQEGKVWAQGKASKRPQTEPGWDQVQKLPDSRWCRHGAIQRRRLQTVPS